MKLYNEELELDRYVWEHFSHYISEFELTVARAASAELKAEHATEAQAKMLRNKWGSELDPDIREALSNGWSAYRTKVRERVMLGHAEQVVINRCPKCSCVVMTPKSKQCLWCGEVWH